MPPAPDDDRPAVEQRAGRGELDGEGGSDEEWTAPGKRRPSAEHVQETLGDPTGDAPGGGNGDNVGGRLADQE